jgi:glycosyltransferase involved in cell wall biosynthesis
LIGVQLHFLSGVMRVAHFNTFLHGGAAIAAKRIHLGLLHFRKTVVSSTFYHGGENSSNPLETPESQLGDFQPLPLLKHKLNRITSPFKYQQFKNRRRRIREQFDRHLAARTPRAETFAMAELPEPTSLKWSQIEAEIAHLHWASFMVDYPSFFQSIPNSVPIVWTLHDMNPFTGGCHYSDQCLHYRYGCGDCPQVLDSHPSDVSRSTLETKRHVLANRRVSVVAPSHWLGKMAQTSPVWPDSTEFHVIRYGLDLQQFAPVDRLKARQALKLDPEAILVGFGAADISAPRKGMRHLLDALRVVKAQWNCETNSRDSIEGVIFGAGEIEGSSELPKLHQLGYLDSIERQRLVYSALDFVIVPSREDNQPQIGIESMACGTPIVAFDSGGISEYVKDGETGLLTPLGDETALANRILTMARSRDLRDRLAVQGRKMMENDFEIKRQSERYFELYQSVILYQQTSRGKQAA